jgi:hypothetical protein
VANNYRGISLLSTSYKILFNILSCLSPYLMKLVEIVSVRFNTTDRLVIDFMHSSDTGEKCGFRENSRLENLSNNLLSKDKQQTD